MLLLVDLASECARSVSWTWHPNARSVLRGPWTAFVSHTDMDTSTLTHPPQASMPCTTHISLPPQILLVVLVVVLCRDAMLRAH